MSCCACIAVFVAVLYILFDVNYFIRIVTTILFGRLFERKKKILDPVTTYGLCTTQDVDLVLKHMNNARYLRELDFARFLYYDRSGIYAGIVKRGGTAVQGASSMRYRRSIPLLMPYKVVTRMIYWEDKYFYLEHQFISLSDNFVRAVCISRQTVSGLKAPVSEIIEELESGLKRPEMTEELRLWLESMEASSQKLRKDK